MCTYNSLGKRNPDHRLEQQTERNIRLSLWPWLSPVWMDWDKTIVFEEFRPTFFLVSVRHNKPWRQFENSGTPTSLPNKPRKRGKNKSLGSKSFIQIWYIFPYMAQTGCLFCWKNGGLSAGELAKSSAKFPRCLSLKTLLKFIFLSLERWLLISQIYFPS